MISTATLRYIRISPRKVRPVIALVKGKQVNEAVAVLQNVKKKASALLIDVISSAIANAERKGVADNTELYVSSLIANGGPQMKRFRAGSMGRASTIRKRTSHITVELDIRKAKVQGAAGASAVREGKKAKKVAVSEKSHVKEAHSATKHKTKESSKIDHSKKGKE